jgi:tRNA(fMet)-specific endonuclease VapC
MYLIDTDICSAHLRNVSVVTGHMLRHAGSLRISSLTLGELLSWTLRSKSPPKYHQGLLKFMSHVKVLDSDQATAWKFGEVRAHLLDRGSPVAAIDPMIAATALIHGLTLVTHNRQHFIKVPGLVIDDWTMP